MATLNQASKKAQQASRIAMLDSLGTDKSEFTTAPLLTDMEEVVGDFIQRVKDNMQSKDLIVTGKIEDLRIETTDTGIQIYGNPWVLWQDRGVNGSVEKKYNTPHSYTDKMPPSYVFEDYIRTKNIQLRHNENYDKDGGSPFADIDGDEKLIRSKAFGFAVKIFKEGFAPQKFFSVEIPQLYTDVKKLVPQFVLSQIVQQMNAKASDQLFTGRK
jgi:hypothetical protein